MRKYLVILTEDMNNGKWLTDEIRYHRNMGYSHIFCFNTRVDTCIPDEMKQYAVCKNLCYRRTELIPRIIGALFCGIYREEKKGITAPYIKEKKSSALWMYAFARLYASMIREELRKYGVAKSDSIAFYAYWMSVQSLTAVILKRYFNNAICVSRCHNVDVYLGRTKYGYIEYQRLLIKENDYIFPISDDGAGVIRSLLSATEGEKQEIADKVIVSRLGCKSVIIPSRIKCSGKLKIITCSTVTPVKRLESVVDILNNIKDIKIEWNHYGDGVLREQFFNKTKALNDNISFTFHGRVPHDEVLARIASGEDDLLLNVSSYEGVPVSIMEAYAAGLPVIATDVGGVREILTGMQSRYLIPCDFDCQEVAGLIRSVANMNEQCYSELSENCRSIWRDLYDSDRNYLEFAEKLYKL